jgi:hypothetical protein
MTAANDNQGDQEPIDPLTLPLNERTIWLVSRLEQVEQLVHGLGDVQKLIIGLAHFDDDQRDRLKAGLTELGMSLPPGTLRTLPIWDALGLLGAGDAEEEGGTPG